MEEKAGASAQGHCLDKGLRGSRGVGRSGQEGPDQGQEAIAEMGQVERRGEGRGSGAEPGLCCSLGSMGRGHRRAGAQACSRTPLTRSCHPYPAGASQHHRGLELPRGWGQVVFLSEKETPALLEFPGAGQGLGDWISPLQRGPRPAETHTGQNQGALPRAWAGMGTQDQANAAPCLPHCLSTQDGPSSP